MGFVRGAREHESRSSDLEVEGLTPVSPPHNLSHEQRAKRGTWCNGMYGISPWSSQRKLGTSEIFLRGYRVCRQGKEFGVRKVDRDSWRRSRRPEAGLGTGPAPRARMMQPVYYRGLYPGGMYRPVDRSRILDPHYWGATARTRRCERTLVDPDSLFRGWGAEKSWIG
jgi:hypothetical protein